MLRIEKQPQDDDLEVALPPALRPEIFVFDIVTPMNIGTLVFVFPG